MEVLFCLYRNFVNNSHSICTGVKSKNAVCPHNGTYDIYIFAIVSKTKTGFVDVVPTSAFVLQTISMMRC